MSGRTKNAPSNGTHDPPSTTSTSNDHQDNNDSRIRSSGGAPKTLNAGIVTLTSGKNVRRPVQGSMASSSSSSSNARAPKKSAMTTNTPFMDSVLDFWDDQQLEDPNQRISGSTGSGGGGRLFNRRPVDVRDELGEAMTVLLNTSPQFNIGGGSVCSQVQRQSLGLARVVDQEQIIGGGNHTASKNWDGSVEDGSSEPVFHPLLSVTNFNRLASLLVMVKTTLFQLRLSRDLPLVFERIWNFLFWNSQPSIWRSVVAFGCLLVVFVASLATAIAIISTWACKFLVLVGLFGLSLLIDWKEISAMLPPTFHEWLAVLLKALVWVDQIALHARRFQGREWNKDDFEYDPRAASQARSSQQGHQLWQLPPPSISQVGAANCTNPTHLRRMEWSDETTQHVAAIDYCYLILREELVRKQYARVRRATYKKLETSDSFGSSNSFPLKPASTELLSEGDLSSSVASLGSRSREPPFQDIDTSQSIITLQGFRKSILFDHRPASKMDPDDEHLDANNGCLEMDFSSHLLDILEDDSDESNSGSEKNSLHSRTGSLDSGSDNGNDMNWIDVGAEIGIKLLGSAAVQKAMTSQDTVEKIITIKEKVGSHIASGSHNQHPQLHHGNAEYNLESEESKDKGDVGQILPTGQESTKVLSLPVHPMWTSASAVISPTHSYATDPGDEKEELLADLYASSQEELAVLPTKSTRRANEKKQGHPANKQLYRCTSSDITTGTDEDDQQTAEAGTTTPVARMLNKSVRKPSSTSSFRPVGSSIEVVCDDNDSRKVLIRSTSSASSAKVMSSPPAVRPKRPLLMPGVKIVVPICPVQPGSPKFSSRNFKSRFQMATVVSSKRLCVYTKNKMPPSGKRGTNCLSITVKLDKCFLRNGEFATMTIRVMDEWSARFMPKHSKLPLGSCVATNFGLGVLVGWRVEDDMHIVRSLWQRRGPGSACAYLRRDSIHSTVEAAVGFDVGTAVGQGKVLAYVHGGKDFRCGRFFVKVLEEGRHHSQTLELNRADVLSCPSARFIPIVEHIREAAQYRLQIDVYEEILKEQENELATGSEDSKLWGEFSKYFSILWKSFLRAIESDDEFDEGMNAFIQQCVNFLERLDATDGSTSDPKGPDIEATFVITTSESSSSSKKSAPNAATSSEKVDSGFWLTNNIFDIFRGQDKATYDENGLPDECIEIECASPKQTTFDTTYERAFAVLRTLMRTITIAQAASADEPDFKMALSVCYEFLLFVKTVIKVQQRNMNPASIEVWRRAWEEIVSVFGPVKDRLTKIGTGIAERMEKQGRRAKVRLLRFVDIIVQDDSLLLAIEQGDWGRCVDQIEQATVRAKIIDELSREHYHKTAQFLFNHFSRATATSKTAAARNNEKFARFLMALQLFAAPRKSFLKLFRQDWVLDAIERMLVRVFSKDAVACRMLIIHSSNFKTLRQFRMLKDFTIAGKLWMPLLDAADEEFSCLVSNLPDNAKEFLSPIASLFSLCVVQFHKINEGDLTKDWLDFLLEDDAASIIHDIDMKVILALEAFSRDVKETMVVLPYYPSIDDDILKLVDEVDVDELVKEASVALEDEERFGEFVKEKVTMAIERFLDYLPKLSIPVEKRELGNGWTLTCRGADGGDLTLTDLTIKRENLMCRVLGGDTIFFPVKTDSGDNDTASTASMLGSPSQLYGTSSTVEESSILDHIRELILNAKRYGCWQVGVGGVNLPPADKYVASVLHDLPVSSVLNCAIDLWRNLEIDDDELLEIAIRDISYQIQLQQRREEQGEDNHETKEDSLSSASAAVYPWEAPNIESVPVRRRFNPRVDATVFFLEIKKLTFNLENFLFRIEKQESKRTIFDPVFEGSGSVLVQNVSVKLRVDCVKEYVRHASKESAVPLLQLRELDVSLEKVKLRVRDTGADWLLNKVVEGFADRFTEIMSTNLCEQVRNQIEEALKNMNSYFESNPEVLLGLLDITLDDLDEKIVWV